jgi:hypothetical protein
LISRQNSWSFIGSPFYVVPSTLDRGADSFGAQPPERPRSPKLSEVRASFEIMNIIEEHRTEVRVGVNKYSVEVAALPSDDRSGLSSRVAVIIGAVGPEGESVAEGRIEVDTRAALTLGTVLSDTLLSFAGISNHSRRRPAVRPAQQGRPWTDEQDTELERLWQAGESVEDIAARFERTPGGIRARLPRVGCDPEKQGAYLPVPPSRRAEFSGGDAE